MDERRVKNCTYLKDHEILLCLNNDMCIDKNVKGYATFYGLLEGWSFLSNSLGPFAMFHSLLLIDPFCSSFNCLLILSVIFNCLVLQLKGNDLQPVPSAGSDVEQPVKY